MKKTHKLFLGLGAVTTVLAPIAAVVACDNNNKGTKPEVKNTGNQTPGTNAGNQTPGTNNPVVVANQSSRTLDVIKASSWDATTNTLDITKINNTYELGLLLSDLTQFNTLKGIVDDFKWTNDANGHPDMSSVEAAYNKLLARFGNVAHDFDFHIKNGIQTKDFSIKTKDLGTKLIEGFKSGYVGNTNIPALSLMWGQTQAKGVIAGYEQNKAQMEAAAQQATQAGVQTSPEQVFAHMTVAQGPLGQSLNVAGNESAVEASIVKLLTGSKVLFDEVGQQMGGVTSIPLVASLASVIGLNSLMGVVALTELPLPAVGAFFQVLNGVSDNLNTILSDPIVASSDAFKNYNPSNDAIKSRQVTTYDDNSSDVKEVLLATFGFESIIA